MDVDASKLAQSVATGGKPCRERPKMGTGTANQAGDLDDDGAPNLLTSDAIDEAAMRDVPEMEGKKSGVAKLRGGGAASMLAESDTTSAGPTCARLLKDSITPRQACSGAAEDNLVHEELRDAAGLPHCARSKSDNAGAGWAKLFKSGRTPSCVWSVAGIGDDRRAVPGAGGDEPKKARFLDDGKAPTRG